MCAVIDATIGEQLGFLGVSAARLILLGELVELTSAEGPWRIRW